MQALDDPHSIQFVAFSGIATSLILASAELKLVAAPNEMARFEDFWLEQRG